MGAYIIESARLACTCRAPHLLSFPCCKEDEPWKITRDVEANVVVCPQGAGRGMAGSSHVCGDRFVPSHLIWPAYKLQQGVSSVLEVLER